MKHMRYFWDYNCPSVAGAGGAGMRAARITEFPRWRQVPSLPNWCLFTPSSSCPVCLARAPASLVTTLTAYSPHPPRDSTTTGRQERDALPGAGLPCSAHLPQVGVGGGVAGGGGRPLHSGPLEGVDHRDVDGSVEAGGELGDEDIGRPGVLPRNEEPGLLGGPEPSGHRHLV